MKRLLMGASAWGDYHIDMLLNHCLPSLSAHGNLPKLCKQCRVTIRIYTTEPNRILHHPIVSKLAIIGVDFNIVGVTEPVGDKYKVIGEMQQEDLRLAKSMGADYHLLMPDFVYSENCFSGIMKAVEKGHKAIARLVVSTSQEHIMPALEGYRSYEVLSISALALATLALKYIHPGFRNWLATKEGYPNTHVIAWEGENSLHLCSPHCTPVYVANEVIHPTDDNIPLDSILDKVIVGEIYCPKPDDGIMLIEITPEAGRKPDDKRVDLVEFCRIFKEDTGNSMRQWNIFDAETIDPICRRMLGGDWWNDVEIAKAKQIVHNALLENMGI